VLVNQRGYRCILHVGGGTVMENPEVAQIFDEIADLLELQNANPFRVRAYRTAARTVRDLSEPLAAIVHDDPNKLTELAGIGEDLAGKIQAIVETGDLPLRIELCKQVPAGLREMMRLPGCGPKRVQLLHTRLGIDTIEALGRAAKRHAIRELKGFGAKSEENILKALKDAAVGERRMYLADAKVYADAIVRHLRQTPGIIAVEAAGSFRRRKETVGDLDLLACAKRPKAVMDRLQTFEGLSEVLARGKTKMTIRLKCGLQLDLRVVPERSYGAALQYFTGSKAHNILIRKLGQDRKLKINEYGVFRGRRYVTGRTEAEVYQAVGLPWIPPELREARGEVELAQAGELPKLIELGDIRGDLHMHTTATDGRATIEEMITAAKARGYRYIAITDHSKRVTMANGLDGRRLRAHWKEIERIAEEHNDMAALKGVEVDILEDGRMDLPDSVLSEADWVIASIHYGQNQSKRQITRRLLNAVRHPHVHAIGHPSGRLIGVRKPYEAEWDDVFQAAADFGCLMELNCQPSRLDLGEAALAAAVKHGVMIVLGTDAHATEELRFMEFGVYQARRAGLEAVNVVNTKPLPHLVELFKQRRPTRLRRRVRAASAV
jgi:DNA polymerase (family 10)